MRRDEVGHVDDEALCDVRIGFAVLRCRLLARTHLETVVQVGIHLDIDVRLPLDGVAPALQVRLDGDLPIAAALCDESRSVDRANRCGVVVLPECLVELVAAEAVQDFVVGDVERPYLLGYRAGLV